MIEFLADRAPWYAVGLALGLCVVAAMGLLNARLGAVGGYSELIERATGRRRALGAKGWFVAGILGGAVLYTLLGGRTLAGEGYGWLSRALTGDAALLIGPVLFAAGVLIGYGAKLAGGCTSGNGLCGSSLGSRSSMVATATFMATAVAVTFALKAVA